MHCLLWHHLFCCKITFLIAASKCHLFLVYLCFRIFFFWCNKLFTCFTSIIQKLYIQCNALQIKWKQQTPASSSFLLLQVNRLQLHHTGSCPGQSRTSWGLSTHWTGQSQLHTSWNILNKVVRKITLLWFFFKTFEKSFPLAFLLEHRIFFFISHYLQ